ncbi:LysM domain-containing protein [Actinacidiphila yanglinensis]|uniref:LysM domain-containing protein n=1 Tax=Actinacidiphila yanglinensis TaxID=310779 RepID=A0A1H6CN08_9ACTN|nr:LysM peptidoglycan-binding domain-containing M23 family metallopeptidase [Actinacidiphila yanglinensis]SEG74352.1 LysM domain-containing protein [Actinacidiphila yanglinensis]
MPAHNRHRRTRTRNTRGLTRLYTAAAAGGAALVVPLVAATHAGAATPAASTTVASTTYKVVKGDTLAKIATAHHVKGGWKQLYQDNKSVIGANPGLIHPGTVLTLGAPAKAVVKAKPAAATTASTGWMKPVGDAAIGTGYKASGSLWSSGSHTGVDFLVGTGTPVHVVAAGTVVSAGADGAYGNDVIVRHADGKYTLYGHLSQTLVSAGQSVTEGQEIGISGATGNVTGPHLHFEVRTTPSYGSDIDPVAYMAGHGVTI